MIDEAKKVRNNKIEEKQDLLINMRPEFVSALKNSISFSSKNTKTQ